jgi:hypothetical protein
MMVMVVVTVAGAVGGWLYLFRSQKAPAPAKPTANAKPIETLVTYTGAIPYALHKPRHPDVVLAMERVSDGIMKAGHVPRVAYTDGVHTLQNALQSSPNDFELRMQYAQMLFDADRWVQPIFRC